MSMNNTYNLFISHAWDYADDYSKLIELLDTQSSLDWRDQSVPRSSPVLAPDLIGIREALARRIFQVDAVLVVSGIHHYSSKWVQYELYAAREYGKPVIGIEPRRPAAASAEVVDAATTIVEWKADSIARTIRYLVA
ncbi:MAG: hypothetical protein F4X65_04950 [Chloroflexi bacterium]|nr:hypothetical protein [Chloroflexota bacterium]